MPVDLYQKSVIRMVDSREMTVAEIGRPLVGDRMKLAAIKARRERRKYKIGMI